MTPTLKRLKTNAQIYFEIATAILTAVSYTHLDVYKRQHHGCLRPFQIITEVLLMCLNKCVPCPLILIYNLFFHLLKCSLVISGSAVSYTHLDVYKRQVQYMSPFRPDNWVFWLLIRISLISDNHWLLVRAMLHK